MTLAEIIEELGTDFYEFQKKSQDEIKTLRQKVEEGAGGMSAEEIEAHTKRLDDLEARMNEPRFKDNGAAPPPLTWKDADGSEIPCLAGNQRAYKGSVPNPLGRRIASASTGKHDPDLETKANFTGVDSSGGYTLAEPQALHGIDLARAASVVSQAGAQTVLLNDGTRMATALKLTADPTVYWVAEREEITESDIIFGRINVEPVKAAILGTFSRELIEDSPNAAQLIEATLQEAMAAEIDRVALVGSGAGVEPTGVSNYDGINVITSVGDVTYDDILNAKKKVAEAFHTPNAGIWSPETDYNLSIQKDTNDGQYLIPPRGYSDLSKYITSKATDALAFVGDFTKLYWAIKPGGMRVEASPHPKFSSDQIQIRLIFAVDVWLGAPAAFCKLSGITDS